MTYLKQALDRLAKSELENQAYRVSKQETQKVQSLLSKRQCLQTEHLRIGLAYLSETYANEDDFLSPSDKITLLQSVVISLQELTTGLCSPLQRKNLHLEPLFNTIKDLFALKIYKKEISFEVDCPEDLTISGDETFLLMILINFVGKAIYRAYAKGRVCVVVSQREKSTVIDISDSGPPLSRNAEELILSSFDLFVDEKSLQKLCKPAGIAFEGKKKANKNFTKLIISFYESENRADNVVSLF